jgi:hypothetical protein
MRISQNYLPKFRRVTLVCAFLLFLTFCFFASTRPGNSQSADKRDRIVTKLRRGPMPVEIKSIKTKRGTVELGKNFPEEDDWFDGLTVSIKNTSGKTIIYLGGGFLFPRPEDEPSQQSAPPRYHRFMYGRHPLLPDDALQTIEPINVKPGEIFNVTISGEDYRSVKQRLRELGYSASVKEINFNVEEIYFDDGTGWSVGSWYERDPNNPGKWIRGEHDTF